MAYLAKIVLFFAFMALGLWGWFFLAGPWNWIALVAAFIIGGSASMLTFKRLATKGQRMQDLDARLHND